MMKKIIVLFIVLGTTFTSNGQNKIESTGNVGIGTTVPSQKLEVKGNILLKSDSYVHYAIERGNGAKSAFGVSSNTHDGFLSSSGNLKFLTNNNGTSYTSSMFINGSGNVGIGTTVPSKLLDVNGDARIGNLNNRQYLKISSLQWPEIRFETPTSNEKIRIGVAHADNNNYGVSEGDFYVYTSTAGRMPLVVNKNGNISLVSKSGNVGIGTSNPSSKLEILKNADLSNAMTIPDSGLIIRANNDGNDASLRFGVDNTNLKAVIQTQQTTTGAKFDLLFNPFGGNVGIGTNNPGSWKLAVNGNIRAKEIKVETGWSDFVFYDDYKLPTLSEVESHIKEKGHLKDIPSAKEVAKNGIFLGEMDAKLLQKIEELTLYTIEQEKEIKRQKEEILKLKKLEERIKNLEAKK